MMRVQEADMCVYLHCEPGVPAILLASYEAAGAPYRHETPRGLRAFLIAWLRPFVLHCDARTPCEPLQIRTAPSESNSLRAGGLGDEPM